MNRGNTFLNNKNITVGNQGHPCTKCSRNEESYSSVSKSVLDLLSDLHYVISPLCVYFTIVKMYWELTVLKSKVMNITQFISLFLF